MRKVNVIVENAGKNLSAYVEDAPIMVVGNNMAEVERNARDAISFYLEDNDAPCEALRGEFELCFTIDVPTFISAYKGVFTKAALSRITGINERQLWHYAAGVHKPRQKQLDKIQRGIEIFSSELSSINLV